VLTEIDAKWDAVDIPENAPLSIVPGQLIENPAGHSRSVGSTIGEDDFHATSKGNGVAYLGFG
jgi:hypothetical protein